MARLYGAARLYVNFFQPSFKLKEKRREGAKVIKRYHGAYLRFDVHKDTIAVAIADGVRAGEARFSIRL